MTSNKPPANQPTDKNRKKAAHDFDPRAELGLQRPTEAAGRREAFDKQTRLNREETEAQRKEPFGPGQYRSGIDEPGEPTKKNAGHTSPQHNTPGLQRHDGPSSAKPPIRADMGSYPGVMGPKARELTQESKPPTEPASQKHPDTIPSPRDDSKGKAQ